jgi:hypothetical protein
MTYMLLIVEDPAQRGTRTRAEGEALYQRMLDFGAGLRNRGLLRASESLTSLDEASRVRVRDGKRQVMDGPFAEAKEMVGGFFLVNCANRDEALALAAECPASEWATVEVRPLGPCFA